MTDVGTQRQVSPTWANPLPILLNKDGYYPLNTIPVKARTITASETLDPDAASIVFVDVTAGAVTITIPANTARYVGKKYTLFCGAQAANNMVVTSTGGHLLMPGSAAVTSCTTTTNTQPSEVEIYVYSSTQVLVTNKVNVTAA